MTEIAPAEQLAHLQQLCQLKQLELNSLLEITQAINADVTEEALYKIFHFTLRGNLGVLRMALFVREAGEGWHCKADYGVEEQTLGEELAEQMTQLKNTSRVQDIGWLAPLAETFDYVVPVRAENSVRANVLLGADEEITEDALQFVRTLSNILFVAIENKRLVHYRIEQEAARREKEIARRVQQQLFPKALPQEDFLTLEASYRPHDSVGGDYYDCIRLNEDQFLLCIADVSGKGTPAALLMANFQASLRTLARQTTDMLHMVEELNLQIRQNSYGENFITAFLALCDRRTRTLTYVNAGHNPPVLLDEAGYRMLETGTTVLGIFEELPAPEVASEPLRPSLLFAYTDGVVETFNAEAEPYGFERLLDLLREEQHAPLPHLHAQVMKALETFRGREPFSDDITMLSARIGQP
ncbi:MAG: PP2C family protein-serine/threonine phosphatase [Catalinimonas sp.]